MHKLQTSVQHKANKAKRTIKENPPPQITIHLICHEPSVRSLLNRLNHTENRLNRESDVNRKIQKTLGHTRKRLRLSATQF